MTMILLLRILLVRGLPHPTGHWTGPQGTNHRYTVCSADSSSQHAAHSHAARSTQHTAHRRSEGLDRSTSDVKYSIFAYLAIEHTKTDFLCVGPYVCLTNDTFTHMFGVIVWEWYSHQTQAYLRTLRVCIHIQWATNAPKKMYSITCIDNC